MIFTKLQYLQSPFLFITSYGLSPQRSIFCDVPFIWEAISDANLLTFLYSACGDQVAGFLFEPIQGEAGVCDLSSCNLFTYQSGLDS